MRVMVFVGKGVLLHSAVCFMSMDVCLHCVSVNIWTLLCVIVFAVGPSLYICTKILFDC